MSINMVDLVKSYISPDLVTRVSTTLGEGEEGISKALSGLVPAILSGIIEKGSASEADAAQLLHAAKDANNSGLLGHLSSFFGNTDLQGQGTGWFNKIFGRQSGGMIEAIAGYAGIKSSSSASLVSMISPLIMGLLGKQAADQRLDAAGFAVFLKTQQPDVLSAFPPELSSPAAMQATDAEETALPETAKQEIAGPGTTGHHTVPVPGSTGGGIKWLLPLLLLAALAFLFWWLMGKGCNTEPVAPGADTVATAPLDTAATLAPATTASGTLDTATGNYIYDVGAGTEIKLADGTLLKVGENSTEARLYHMLNDAAFSVDTVNKSANWVVLDRVYFETGKSVLTAGSAAQILNIAAILKNFPNAAIQLGGYTDNTGDAAINKKISADRAKIVSDEMIHAGAEAKQIVEAAGYGSEFPVCEANDIPACKAQNRRVDLKVAVK